MYFYFGGDQLVISVLFLLISITALGCFLALFALSFKILLAVKYIIEYIKKRGER